MPSLRESQAGFASALLGPGALSDAPGIRADGISPAVRLGFYRTNIFENYRKALSASFPAVERLVGKGFFHRLAEEYIRRHASSSGDVGRFGEGFPEFLRRHACAYELPYLSDVARLEWCIEESFNEADPEPLALERLAAVPEHQCEHLRFLLAPSCRLLTSAFPVDRIWEMCQLDSDEDWHIDLDAGEVELLVRRDGFEVAVESQRPAEFAMLAALAAGATFGDALDSAIGVDQAFDPGALLQHHVATGVLADFTLSAEAHAPWRP
jgi:hypothetical protein